MERILRMSIFEVVLIILLMFAFSGCTAHKKKRPEVASFPYKGKGYIFELKEVKAGSFETSPYIPEKIRFELERFLRQRDLLAGSPGPEKRLAVYVKTKASYAGFADNDAYGALESEVKVIDRDFSTVIAQHVQFSLNPYSFGTTDFTEVNHARSIADFLENLVR